MYFLSALHARRNIRENQEEPFKLVTLCTHMQTKHLDSSGTWGKKRSLLQRDNVVPAAEVATADTSLRRIHIKRPIQKLYPLEVNLESLSNDDGDGDANAAKQ